MVKTALRLEGLTVCVAAVILYAVNDFSWWWFFGLAFAPDLAAIAYIAGPRTGSIVYNFFHTYILSIAAVLIGWFFNMDAIILVGLVWTAHIGIDRLCGYGLKSPTDFKETHLQTVNY